MEYTRRHTIRHDGAPKPFMGELKRTRPRPEQIPPSSLSLCVLPNDPLHARSPEIGSHSDVGEVSEIREEPATRTQSVRTISET